MKRAPFKRKTPLKTKCGFKRKPTKKRRKKSPLQKAKIKLWTLCREITRARYGNTCYTCGKTGLEGSSWQTGHFISSSICSAYMRYHLDNLRIQCYNCNINKSGNWLAFEDHLEKDGIDTDALKQLNRDTQGLQYDSIWYEEQIEMYQNELAEI